ncbi:MAG: hypothetical protein ACRC5A_15410, partial [Enterobacteriaceae bacterium]
MLPELGNFALALALGLSLLLGIYPLWGAARGDQAMMASARPLTWGLSGATLLAFLCLCYAFASN